MLYSLQEHSTHIARIAVASEGECIATVGEDQTLNIWQRGTYRHLARLRGHTNQINSLAISPDGQTIVTGSGRDGVTRVWRTDRFDASELSNVGSWIAGFTSDSQTLVLGPRRGDSRWQLVGGLNATVLIPSNSISALDLRNRPFDVYGDKPLGMLGRSNGLVELWDLSAGRQVDSWPAETDEITFVRLSPDGRRVTTGSAAGHLRIWRVSDHSPVAEFIAGRGPVRAIAYSPDGRVLAAACQESPIQFWDAASCRSLPAAGEQRGICWIEFSPDGGTVAVANLSGGVHLYDARSRALLAELRGHVMGVLRASFFPDGKTLATGSLDGRVKLWNLATCQELLTLTVPLGGTFHSLAIAPNGCTLAVGYLGSPGHHVLLYRAPSLEERAEREPDAVRWFRP